VGIRPLFPMKMSMLDIVHGFSAGRGTQQNNRVKIKPDSIPVSTGNKAARLLELRMIT